MECLQFAINFFDFDCDPMVCFLPSQAAMANDDDFHLSCSDLPDFSFQTTKFPIFITYNHWTKIFPRWEKH